MTVTVDPTGGLGQTEMLRRLATLAGKAAQEILMDQDASVTLINQSENSTYLVRCANYGKCILRIHRTGYHSLKAIESELTWMKALREDVGIETPTVIEPRFGSSVHHVKTTELPHGRHCVFFKFLDGEEPAEDDLLASFPDLGEVTARMHKHAKTWNLPGGFERFTWNIETAFGANPHWGRWYNAPGVTSDLQPTLNRLLGTIKKRLSKFGCERERFGLAHCDMRLANLLIDGATTKVIDFDDCGFSWYLYDMATALTFTEDRSDVPELIDAWVEGYSRVSRLSSDEKNEIPTLIMYRRLLALAWIGSHAETDLARSLAETFAPATVNLAENYLTRYG